MWADKSWRHISINGAETLKMNWIECTDVADNSNENVSTTPTDDKDQTNIMANMTMADSYMVRLYKSGWARRKEENETKLLSIIDLDEILITKGNSLNYLWTLRQWLEFVWDLPGTATKNAIQRSHQANKNEQRNNLRRMNFWRQADRTATATATLNKW